jgi:hypothetical protein
LGRPRSILYQRAPAGNPPVDDPTSLRDLEQGFTGIARARAVPFLSLRARSQPGCVPLNVALFESCLSTVCISCSPPQCNWCRLPADLSLETSVSGECCMLDRLKSVPASYLWFQVTNGYQRAPSSGLSPTHSPLFGWFLSCLHEHRQLCSRSGTINVLISATKWLTRSDLCSRDWSGLCPAPDLATKWLTRSDLCPETGGLGAL